MSQPRLSLTRRLSFARTFASMEALWPRLFALVLLAGAFLAAAALDVFAALPLWGHRLLLLGLAGALVWQIYKSIQGFSWASRTQGARWFERGARVAHRPLEALEDQPAGDDPVALALWQRHQERMAQEAATAQLARPDLNWLSQDPMALRFGILLVLVVGLLAAGSDFSRRLNASISLDPRAVPRSVALDLWITPPDYTGRPPVVLTADMDRVALPEGSRVTARLNGGTATPVLQVGEQNFTFQSDQEATHTLERILPTGGDMQVRQGGRERGAWRLDYVADKAPSIRFAGAPELTPRHALSLPYSVLDDYAMTDGQMIMRRGEGNQVRYGPRKDKRTEEAVFETALPPLETKGVAIDTVLTVDLAEHYWAGEAVEIILSATDALDQTSQTAPLIFTLPERPFAHSVAAEVVAIRKSLIRSSRRSRSDALRRLDAVAREPGRFDGDLVAFAALRSSYWRLRNDRSQTSLDEVIAQLWQTALRIEDGSLSLAERNLRQTLSSLQDALQGDGDLSQLTQQLMQQLDDLLAAQQDDQPQSSQAPPSSPQGQTQLIDRQTLQAMAQRIQELAQAGRTQEAQQLLQQLQSILENLQPNPLSPEQMQQMMAAAQAADALEDLKQEQRELLNKTARQTVLNRLLERRGQEGQDFDPLGEQQQSITQGLQDLLDNLAQSGLPQQTDAQTAEQAARDAQEALGEQAGGDAVSRQAEALQALEQASDALQQQLAQQRQQQSGQGGGFDPLGNPRSNMDTRSFQLPDEDEIRRARAIQEQLRERLADPDLPAEERAYIERLLRRF